MDASKDSLTAGFTESAAPLIADGWVGRPITNSAAGAEAWSHPSLHCSLCPDDTLCCTDRPIRSLSPTGQTIYTVYRCWTCRADPRHITCTLFAKRGVYLLTLVDGQPVLVPFVPPMPSPIRTRRTADPNNLNPGLPYLLPAPKTRRAATGPVITGQTTKTRARSNTQSTPLPDPVPNVTLPNALGPRFTQIDALPKRARTGRKWGIAQQQSVGDNGGEFEQHGGDDTAEGAPKSARPLRLGADKSSKPRTGEKTRSSSRAQTIDSLSGQIVGRFQESASASLVESVVQTRGTCPSQHTKDERDSIDQALDAEKGNGDANGSVSGEESGGLDDMHDTGRVALLDRHNVVGHGSAVDCGVTSENGEEYERQSEGNENGQDEVAGPPTRSATATLGDEDRELGRDGQNRLSVGSSHHSDQEDDLGNEFMFELPIEPVLPLELDDDPPSKSRPLDGLPPGIGLPIYPSRARHRSSRSPNARPPPDHTHVLQKRALAEQSPNLHNVLSADSSPRGQHTSVGVQTSLPTRMPDPSSASDGRVDTTGATIASASASDLNPRHATYPLDMPRRTINISQRQTPPTPQRRPQLVLVYGTKRTGRGEFYRPREEPTEGDEECDSDGNDNCDDDDIQDSDHGVQGSSEDMHRGQSQGGDEEEDTRFDPMYDGESAWADEDTEDAAVGGHLGLAERLRFDIATYVGRDNSPTSSTPRNNTDLASDSQSYESADGYSDDGTDITDVNRGPRGVGEEASIDVRGQPGSGEGHLVNSRIHAGTVFDQSHSLDLGGHRQETLEMDVGTSRAGQHMTGSTDASLARHSQTTVGDPSSNLDRPSGPHSRVAVHPDVIELRRSVTLDYFVNRPSLSPEVWASTERVHGQEIDRLLEVLRAEILEGMNTGGA